MLRVEAEQMIRVVVVRVGLIEIADKLIEPLFVGDTSRAFIAQAPFANQACVIARLFKNLRHSDVLGRQREVARVAANPVVA